MQAEVLAIFNVFQGINVQVEYLRGDYLCLCYGLKRRSLLDRAQKHDTFSVDMTKLHVE